MLAFFVLKQQKVYFTLRLGSHDISLIICFIRLLFFMDTIKQVALTLTLLACAFQLSATNAKLTDYRSVSLVSDDGPPHMIKESNAGIDIDIVKAVFAKMGVDTNLQYAPLARAKLMVEQGKADATVPTFFQQDTQSFFVSDPVINYKPTVFTLSNKKVSFASLSEIKGLKIATFQGAQGYFGDAFIRMSAQNDYREMYDMSVFPKLLLSNRVDAIVLDYYIFHYFAALHVPDYEPRLVQEHYVIPEVPAAVGFHQRALRDAFNSQLTAMKKNNEIQQIINRYLPPREKTLE